MEIYITFIIEFVKKKSVENGNNLAWVLNCVFYYFFMISISLLHMMCR